MKTKKNQHSLQTDQPLTLESSFHLPYLLEGKDFLWEGVPGAAAEKGQFHGNRSLSVLRWQEQGRLRIPGSGQGLQRSEESPPDLPGPSPCVACWIKPHPLTLEAMVSGVVLYGPTAPVLQLSGCFDLQWWCLTRTALCRLDSIAADYSGGKRGLNHRAKACLPALPSAAPAKGGQRQFPLWAFRKQRWVYETPSAAKPVLPREQSPIQNWSWF